MIAYLDKTSVMAISSTLVRGVCVGASAVIAITSLSAVAAILRLGSPADRILVDEFGFNTLASARNCRPILDDHGLSSALIVSHYYHLARCKMAFAEQRVSCTTVPARMSMRLVKEPYYVLRECAAYLAYSVERPFRVLDQPGEG